MNYWENTLFHDYVQHHPEKLCVDCDRLQRHNIPNRSKARKIPKLKWHTHTQFKAVLYKKYGFCLFSTSTSWFVRLGAYKFHFSNDLHDWMQLFAVIYDAYFIYSNIIDNRQGPQYTAHSNELIVDFLLRFIFFAVLSVFCFVLVCGFCLISLYVQ